MVFRVQFYGQNRADSSSGRPLSVLWRKVGGGGAGVGEKGQASLPHASIVLGATLQNSPFELLSNMSSAGERI